jgi:hypothetical protein
MAKFFSISIPFALALLAVSEGVSFAQVGPSGGTLGETNKSASGGDESPESHQGRPAHGDSAAQTSQRRTHAKVGTSSHVKRTQGEPKSPANAAGEESGVREPCVGISGALHCVNRALTGPPVLQ